MEPGLEPLARLLARTGRRLLGGGAADRDRAGAAVDAVAVLSDHRRASVDELLPDRDLAAVSRPAGPDRAVGTRGDRVAIDRRAAGRRRRAKRPPDQPGQRARARDLP